MREENNIGKTGEFLPVSLHAAEINEPDLTQEKYYGSYYCYVKHFFLVFNYFSQIC